MTIDYWLPENFNGNGHYISVIQNRNIFEKETGKKSKAKNVYSKTYIRWLNKKVNVQINRL